MPKHEGKPAINGKLWVTNFCDIWENDGELFEYDSLILSIVIA